VTDIRRLPAADMGKKTAQSRVLTDARPAPIPVDSPSAGRLPKSLNSLSPNGG